MWHVPSLCFCQAASFLKGEFASKTGLGELSSAISTSNPEISHDTSAPEEQAGRTFSKLTPRSLLKCIYFLIPNFIQYRVGVLCGQASSLELLPTERVCWREGKKNTSEESPMPSARDGCQQAAWGYSSTTHLEKP